MADKLQQCPYCGEQIKYDADYCKFCKCILDVKSAGRHILDYMIYYAIWAIILLVIFICCYPLGLILFFLTLLGFYFLPWDLSYKRNHNSTVSIFLINLFFGWSFIGWVIALAWACSSDVKKVAYPSVDKGS